MLHYQNKVVKWTTLFLLIIGGVIFALVSPIFNIKEIQVTNNNQIATETIVSLSQLQVGQNLLLIPLNLLDIQKLEYGGILDKKETI